MSNIQNLKQKLRGANKMITERKPMSLTYVLQSLQGQLVGFHFLIYSLKSRREGAFLVSVGTVSQTFGSK